MVVDRFVTEKRRLELEEEKTEEELLALQQQLNERLSRLMRLRRQKRFLQERGVEMLSKGLSSMEELESSDQLELEAVTDVQAAGALDVIDWNVVLDPSLLDEIPSTGVASS